MGKKSAVKGQLRDQSKDVSAESGKSARAEPAAAGDLTLPEKTSQRKYSLIVWGATGFTGSLVCKQLAETYPVRLSFVSQVAECWNCPARSTPCPAQLTVHRLKGIKSYEACFRKVLGALAKSCGLQCYCFCVTCYKRQAAWPAVVLVSIGVNQGAQIIIMPASIGLHAIQILLGMVTRSCDKRPQHELPRQSSSIISWAR